MVFKCWWMTAIGRKSLAFWKTGPVGTNGGNAAAQGRAGWSAEVDKSWVKIDTETLAKFLCAESIGPFNVSLWLSPSPHCFIYLLIFIRKQDFWTLLCSQGHSEAGTAVSWVLVDIQIKPKNKESRQKFLDPPHRQQLKVEPTEPINCL